MSPLYPYPCVSGTLAPPSGGGGPGTVPGVPRSVASAVIIPGQYVECMRRFLAEYPHSDMSEHGATSCCLIWRPSRRMESTGGAGISCKMVTGPPSTVASTTLSHVVRHKGTKNDPQDIEPLTKPRGFFADQLDVLSRAVSPIRIRASVFGVLTQLSMRCRTGETLMDTTKGLVQRFGDK